MDAAALKVPHTSTRLQAFLATSLSCELSGDYISRCCQSLSRTVRDTSFVSQRENSFVLGKKDRRSKVVWEIQQIRDVFMNHDSVQL